MNDDSKKDLAKFIYDIAKSIFTTMVLGSIASSIIVNISVWIYFAVGAIGLLLTISLAFVAFKISNSTKK